jgi:CheY-like chemotaxis protein
MNVNRLAQQLESLLAVAYSGPITSDLSADLEPAEVHASLADEFLPKMVEEICAYPEVDGILIWTEQTGTKDAKGSRANLGVEVHSSQITVPEARTKNVHELSRRLRDSDCILRLRAVAGRWIRYEFLFPLGVESDHEVYRSGRGETILLVEDEDIIRNVTTQVLEGCGYRVLAAKDAKTAREIFALNRGGIEVLLTDLGLAGESGAELAERLREIDPGLKIVLMSGYAEREMMGHEFGDIGMAYLSKPFSVESLIGRVRQVIQWQPVEEIDGHQLDRTFGAEWRE